MPNQKLITTIQVDASVDKQLPGLDPVNIGNFKCEFTDSNGVNQGLPPTLVLQPASNATLAPAVGTKGTFLFIKSDLPITLQFGVGTILPVATFFALSGDYIALGSLKLSNADVANAANVEILAVGV